MRAEIKRAGGVLRLFIDGEPIAPDAYITYFTHRAHYDDFAERGYRLYSVPIFLSAKTINERSGSLCFTAPLFDEEGEHLDVIDREIERILSACPDALIFPRVNVSPTEEWERANPDELCYEGVREPHRPCFSSDAWAEELERLLGIVIDHIAAAPYADHVIGYQIAAGHTEEWFSHDGLGSIGKRSDEKYRSLCEREGGSPTEEGYYLFLSDVVADRIAALARFAKQRAGRDKLVGSFYGYTLECPFRESCHLSLGRLLDCPDIDFISSPVSYTYGRALGRDHGPMLPTGSLLEHGKLYFCECDTRTHLTRTPYPDIEYFRQPVFGPRGESETPEMLKMHYARSLIGGHGHWWFDMFGGWYANESYMSLMERFLSVSRESLDCPMGSVAELAVFIDERSIGSIRVGSELMNKVYEAREVLGIVGTPYDVYLASDFERVSDRYRAAVLIKPTVSALTDEIERCAAQSSLPLLVMGADRDVSVGELCDFLRRSGVHLYCDAPAVVYANESYLFVHTVSDGELKISMPSGQRLFNMLKNEKDAPTVFAKRGESYLFRIKA